MPDPAALTLYQVLKDFQPSLAALVALAAAIFAYRGAVAKLNYDREVCNEDALAAKISLMLQLRSVVRRLSRELPRLTSTDMPLETIIEHMPTEIPEFDDAWQKLVLLPPATMESLDRARYHLRANRLALANAHFPEPPEEASREALEVLNKAKTSLRSLLIITGEEIAKACREMEASLDDGLKKLHRMIK